MVLEELKHRISSLQRGDVSPRRPSEATEGEARGSADLARHFPEGAVCETGRGDVFVCETPLRKVYSEAPALAARYRAAFRKAKKLARGGDLPVHLEPLAEASSRATALIDTETAGFHGRPLFLIGLVRPRGRGFVVTQYFARTYAEEAGVLSQFADFLPEVDLLISFNGKAFDWPFVRDRMVYHRLSCDPRFAHVDLLYPSRRRWRSELPNCRLQTLERYLCGRWRSGDIPGAEIPQRYHDFVRGQDARLIAPIFHHNRLDLIAMMELLIALVEGGEEERVVSSRAAGATAGGGSGKGAVDV